MKRIISVFLVLMLIMPLGACGGKSTETETNKENQITSEDSQTAEESSKQTTYT